MRRHPVDWKKLGNAGLQEPPWASSPVEPEAQLPQLQCTSCSITDCSMIARHAAVDTTDPCPAFLGVDNCGVPVQASSQQVATLRTAAVQ